jgi:hypothetical protein
MNNKRAFSIARRYKNGYLKNEISQEEKIQLINMEINKAVKDGLVSKEYADQQREELIKLTLKKL